VYFYINPIVVVKDRDALLRAHHLQVTDGTSPLDVAGLKVHETVSTMVPVGCSTEILALVNATSSMVSVQFALAQLKSVEVDGIGLTGGLVVTLNETVPFLSFFAGIACVPVRVTVAGVTKAPNQKE
jgi:hypothetical protein